ncbi:hypothetical protein LEP1GSC186_0508 [Leptospira noguchii serovar Autumnalis str. ZUN142]|uniref:Uncharacterized protein n=1 Tax=Leptospira noguchii serovar Autumnalis str. ZUN142 TaxID=1085540 RepID=M6ULX4_9LEPT|nr:hypothetical protein LEP1GSC186_0508 [Leptospira noguchii serovar Autumnalis str. ZUN142]
MKKLNVVVSRDSTVYEFETILELLKNESPLSFCFMEMVD